MQGRRVFKLLASSFPLFLALAQLAPGQTNDPRYRAEGYGFFSPAGTGSSLGVGFGGDLRLRAGLYAGVDLAGESPNWTLSFGHDEPGYGLASADLSYHFLTPNKRVEPFAEGGYTLDFGHGQANTYNLGGGVAVWFTRHLAFRPEIRYYDRVPGFPPPREILTFRLGLAFR